MYCMNRVGIVCAMSIYVYLYKPCVCELCVKSVWTDYDLYLRFGWTVHELCLDCAKGVR